MAETYVGTAWDQEHGPQYAKELDEAAAIVQSVHPIGQVKAIGRLEVVAALKELFPDDMRQSRLRDLERVTRWLGAIMEAIEPNAEVRLEERGNGATAVELYIPGGYFEPYNLAVFSGDDPVKNAEDADDFAAFVRERLETARAKPSV